MAVQQNKKSPSKRGMHRSHNALTVPGTGRWSRPRRKPTCATTSAPPGFYAAARSLKTKTTP
jgi:large subunit ribosomal protein L32